MLKFRLQKIQIGALLAMALSMQPMAIFSIIGMIMLMGLVAKNGILLVDFTNGFPVRTILSFSSLNE